MERRTKAREGEFLAADALAVTVFVRAHGFGLEVEVFVQSGRVFPGVTFYVRERSRMRPDVLRGPEAANGNGFCARF